MPRTSSLTAMSMGTATYARYHCDNSAGLMGWRTLGLATRPEGAGRQRLLASIADAPGGPLARVLFDLSAHLSVSERIYPLLGAQ